MAKDWLSVLGQAAPELERELSDAVQAKISAGDFEQKDIDYVATLERPLSEDALQVDGSDLEKLRRLCQLWDLELHMHEIKSHRKFVGPLIVMAKRLCFPILKHLMKGMLKQQREFNAQAIILLTELCQKRRRAS